MTDILISEFMEPDAVDRLRAAHSVHIDEELWHRRGELEARVSEARALIVRNRTQVDGALVAMARKLRVIGRLGVGLDNIDLEACRERGITVCPAVGANANSVAEYVIAAALMLLRWAAFSGTAPVLRGEWPRQEAGAGREAADKTLGAIGFGSIGRAVAAKARALDMRVLAFDPQLAADDPSWSGARAGLPELLAGSDIVTLHCPLTPQTRGLIGPSEIDAMKPGTILINTARGGIVDEAALAAALRSGRLGGAALDVFETEPITDRTATLFAGLPNILLTPHIAGVTRESNVRVSAVTADNVLKALQDAVG